MEIMSKLKENVKKALFEAFSKKGFTSYSEKYKYYVKSLDENIIGGSMSTDQWNMFEDGSGGELVDVVTPAKAKAIYSSSMLSYNFFRNINEDCTLKIDHIEYDKVFFEVKLPTLRSSNAPANMDVVLVSKDGKDALFIESKFLEYLENKEYELGISYENPQKWQDKDTNWMDFLKVVRKCVDEESRCKYKEGIKQGVSHIFALSNLVHKNENAISYLLRNNKCLGHDLNKESIKGADIHFINLIFEPSKKCFRDEHEKFDDYKMLYIKFINKVKEHICIEPLFKTYSDLWKSREIEEQIKKVNNCHLYQYLYERYMRFAELE